MSITINRGSVKKLVSVASKALQLTPTMWCTARCSVIRDADGTHYTAGNGQTQITYTDSSAAGEPESYTVPAEVFAAVAGPKGETSQLWRFQNRNRANWWIGPELQHEMLWSPDDATRPALPKLRKVDCLVDTLHELEQCADTESTRYALGGVLIEPTDSGVNLVATDSRQLLVCYGAVPVGAVRSQVVFPAVGIRSIVGRRVKHASIGQDDFGAVTICAGDWTIRSSGIEGRFPRFRDVIRDEYGCLLQLEQADRQWLRRNLDSPGKDAMPGVDIDVNGAVFIRRPDDAEGRQRTDLLCTRSGHLGRDMTIRLNREYLRRAIDISPDLELWDDGSAVVARNTHRAYVAMPLSADEWFRTMDAKVSVLQSTLAAG